MDREKLKEALARLGGSPATVEAKLKEMGCQGTRLVGENCPIAVYLRMNGLPSVVVTSMYVRDGKELVTLPWHVGDFISAFDKGMYPDLEA